MIQISPNIFFSLIKKEVFKKVWNFKVKEKDHSVSVFVETECQIITRNKIMCSILSIGISVFPKQIQEKVWRRQSISKCFRK